MNWGKIISKEREARGWSVVDLSIKSGVKPSTVSYIERGQKQVGSMAFIEMMLNAMDITLSLNGDVRSIDENGNWK